MLAELGVLLLITAKDLAVPRSYLEQELTLVSEVTLVDRL